MKLLFVHEVNYETKVIFEMHEFPELLAAKGHEVHFLQFAEHQKSFKFRSTVKEISGRVLPEVKISLHSPPNFGGEFIGRLISTVISVPLINKLLREENFDAVILYSVPTTGWQTTYLGKKYKIPVIFRALDVSHQIRGGLSRKLVKLAEKYVYRNVNLISANNPKLGLYASQLSKVKKKFVVNVPPLDLSHFGQKANSNLRNLLGINDNDILIIFMGTLFNFSGLLSVVDEYKKIDSKNNSLKLIIVGSGELGEKISEKIKLNKLEKKIILTGQIDYAILPEYFSISDIAINSFEKKFLTDVAFPHKVLQYLAAGVPVISTRLDGLYGVIGENAGVVWIDAPNQIIGESIKLASKGKVNLEKLGAIGRDFVSTNFNKDKATDEFIQMIQSVIDGKI